MKRKSLGDVMEEINEAIPGKEDRLVLFGKGHHDQEVTGTYMYEKVLDESNLNFWNKIYKFFSIKSFYDSKHTPLLRLGESEDLDYRTFQFMEVLFSTT